jgi:hypothetical protein
MAAEPRCRSTGSASVPRGSSPPHNDAPAQRRHSIKPGLHGGRAAMPQHWERLSALRLVAPAQRRPRTATPQHQARASWRQSRDVAALGAPQCPEARRPRTTTPPHSDATASSPCFQGGGAANAAEHCGAPALPPRTRTGWQALVLQGLLAPLSESATDPCRKSAVYINCRPRFSLSISILAPLAWTDESEIP